MNRIFNYQILEGSNNVKDFGVYLDKELQSFTDIGYAPSSAFKIFHVIIG